MFPGVLLVLVEGGAAGGLSDDEELENGDTAEEDDELENGDTGEDDDDGVVGILQSTRC